MCTMVYLSTDSNRDLSQDDRPPLLMFQKDLVDPEHGISLLQHPHRWFVGAMGACSCYFRHLYSIELGFGPPEDWAPEDPENVEATRQFYDVVAALLAAGNRVDCVSQWVETPADAIDHLDVDLAVVSREAFRFFENSHWTFAKWTLDLL
jgi:hypothetical protein